MTAPEFRRVRRGRGHSYELDGQRIPGVTTALSKGVAKPALVGAAAREAGNCVQDYWDDLLEMKPSERANFVRTAHERAWYGAAVRGTEIHALAQRLANGEELDVPDELVGHVDSYLKFTDEWQPRDLLVETPIVDTRWRYAGTLDLIADLADGHRWLLDWKTGGKGIFPESALQLAAYRHAELYQTPDGKLQPLPRVDRTGCVWLQADGYQLVPVNTGPDELLAFLGALSVCRWIEERAPAAIEDTLTAPVLEGEAA